MQIEIDFTSDKAIYTQLYESILLSIAKGDLKAGDALPAVRTLAEEIGINLHTVNKAYGLLKDDGYVTMDRRKGTIINVLPAASNTSQLLALQHELELLAAKGHLMGLLEDDFINQCKNYFTQFKEV